MSGREPLLVEIVPPPLREQSCRLCGARRGRDEPDDDWEVDQYQDLPDRSHLRRRRDENGVERLECDERPGSRRHAACIPSASAVVEAVTGIELGDGDAREVLNRHGRILLAGDRRTSTRTPWGHLLPAEVEAVRTLALAVSAPPTPVPSPAGRCGVCGVGASASWTRWAGLVWEDGGGAAPVCLDCAALRPAPGGDLDRDLMKVGALSEVAGVRPGPSLRAHGYFGFRVAAEVLHDDERHDDAAGRWTYREAALQRVRYAVRSSLPGMILDDDERAEGIRLLEARRAKAAAEQRTRDDGDAPGWE